MLATVLANQHPAVAVPAGSSPHPAARRLLQVQRDLDVITRDKRAAYAGAVAAERRLAAARRALAGARIDVARVVRLRDPILQAQGARLSRLILAMTEADVAATRSRLRELEAMGQAFRDEIKERFRPLHGSIHGLLEAVGATVGGGAASGRSGCSPTVRSGRARWPGRGR